jgi:uncharacterized membrane protein
MKKDIVMGLFTDKKHADMAVDELKDVGYNASEISVITRDMKRKADEKEKGSDLAKKTGAGAVGGGVIGGVAGLIAGAVAAVPTGGASLFVVGPLAAAWGLTGAGIGALSGGIIGALTSLGISEDDAGKYAKRIEQGDILIAVPAQLSDEVEARRILDKHGADDVTTLTINRWGEGKREEAMAH